MATTTTTGYTKHSEFYFEYVYIQVEDELFKIPRHRFEEESEFFKLLSPRPREELGTSWIPEKPLVFRGFSKAEFCYFLALFYPRAVFTPVAPTVTVESLEAGLKVATALELFATRLHFSTTLANCLDLGSRLIIVIKYWNQQLVKTISSDLLDRDEPLSDEEAASMGFETAFYISRARENIRLEPDQDWNANLQVELESQRHKYETVCQRAGIVEDPSNPKKATYHVKETIFLVRCWTYQIMAMARKLFPKVEDELFNVPRYPFLHNSEIFSDMLSLPSSQAGAEGDSESNPIVLSGINKHEFVLLLQALHLPCVLNKSEPFIGLNKFSTYHESRRKMTWDDLATLLKLSTMWRFTTIRDETIVQLDGLFQASPNQWLRVHQLALGQSQKVPSWIVDGYYHLAIRSLPLSTEERELLDAPTIWTIIEFRDTYYLADHHRQYYRRRPVTKAEIEARIANQLREAMYF